MSLHPSDDWVVGPSKFAPLVSSSESMKEAFYHKEGENSLDSSSRNDPVAYAMNKKKLASQSAMNLAKSPASQIFMTGFMLWLTGNSLQIFSIIMLGMSTWRPISAIISTNSTFAKYDSAQISLAMPKLIYIALNMIVFLVCVYKAQNMGLVPTLSELEPLPAADVRDTVIGINLF
jgi:hypothetical protein